MLGAPIRKPPEGGFLTRKQKITSSRGLREQQVRPVQQEPKRQQQEPVPVREQRREQERGPVRAPSCHMQPEQRRRRWRPERETCSFFDSLMNEKNIFHFAESLTIAARGFPPG